jgi:hypothetical protein
MTVATVAATKHASTNPITACEIRIAMLTTGFAIFFSLHSVRLADLDYP